MADSSCEPNPQAKNVGLSQESNKHPDTVFEPVIVAGRGMKAIRDGVAAMLRKYDI